MFCVKASRALKIYTVAAIQGLELASLAVKSEQNYLSSQVQGPNQKLAARVLRIRAYFSRVLYGSIKRAYTYNVRHGCKQIGGSVIINLGVGIAPEFPLLQ